MPEATFDSARGGDPSGAWFVNRAARLLKWRVNRTRGPFLTTGYALGMRQGPHQKRGRGRGNRRPNTPNRNQTFDSNGPDVRIRGNAHQVYEKYLNLARDASASGDRVLAESYFQHADHYFRIVSAFAENEAERRERNAANGAQPDVQARDWNAEDDDRQEDRAARSQDREPRAPRDDAVAGAAEDDAASDEGRGNGRGRRGRPRRQREDGSRDEDQRIETRAVDAAGDEGQNDRAAAVGSADAASDADSGEADGMRRMLKVAEPSVVEAASEEEVVKPRRRRRAPAAEAAPDPVVSDDDGAAAAS